MEKQETPGKERCPREIKFQGSARTVIILRAVADLGNPIVEVEMKRSSLLVLVILALVCGAASEDTPKQMRDKAEKIGRGYFAVDTSRDISPVIDRIVRQARR